MPVLTFYKEHEEADICVEIKTRNLSHETLDCVPLIEFQDICVFDFALDPDGRHDLRDEIDYRVERVDNV